MFLQAVCLILKICVTCGLMKTMESEVLANDNDAVTLKYSESSIENNRTNVAFILDTAENIPNIGYFKDGVVFEEPRKRKQDQKGFMQRILPMMIIPFMISSSMIPMMLIAIKFMLLKSAVVGVIGISLMLINMFRRRTSGQGVYTHNINANDEAMEHYGYRGDEEYGAYVNKRRRKRKADVR